MSVRALLAAIASLAASCSSNRYNITVDLLPEVRLVFVLLGEDPAIEVENHGPGAITVVTENTEGTYRSQLALGSPGVSTQGKLRGPVRLHLAPISDEPARVDLDLRGVIGVDLRRDDAAGVE